MWSGPRNISTAMMRSFENRPDCAVTDEPFYAAYLAVTGLDHPMRDEVLAAQPQDWRVVARALENARRLTSALGRKLAQSPIVPVILGEAKTALAASAMLEANGYLVIPIRPPTVPPGTARLRFACSAMHRPEDIDRVAELLKAHGFA